MSVSQALPTQTPRVLKTSCAAWAVSQQRAGNAPRPLRLQRGRARAFPEMPPRCSWAAPPGSGQEVMTVPGWQEWSPSSSLAGEILPAPWLQLGRFPPMPTAQGGVGEEH